MLGVRLAPIRVAFSRAPPSGLAGRAGDEVRTSYQRPDCQGARPHRAATLLSIADEVIE